MPKSAKRRKDKAADFTKAKLKLGKGKQTPSNVIDTSFKARSIALPSQSIVFEKDDDTPATRRKLTFDDLISNIKHHNAGSRRDALFGLKELLDGHWELTEGVLPTLLNATVKLISDEDVSVRKALIGFFSWLLPRLPRGILSPHGPLLLLFTTSAQTHIFPEIRIDAVRLLNVLLEFIPETIVEGWDSGNGHGTRVLEGYLGILNAGTLTGDAEGPPAATSTATVMLSLNSKLAVLHSLSRFLEIALSLSPFLDPSSTNPRKNWFLSPLFTNQQAYLAFDNLLQPSSSKKRERCHIWSTAEDNENDSLNLEHLTATHILSSWDLQELSVVPDSQELQDATNPFIARLAKILHTTLISAFLDCAPAVFSPSTGPPETEMNVILEISQITHTLYGRMLMELEYFSSSTAEELRTILGHMSPFFPFKPHGRHDTKVEQVFQDLNLIYCDLLSRLVLASQSSTEKTTVRSKKAFASNKQHLNTNDKLWVQSDHVCDYIVGLLGGNDNESESNNHLARPLSPAAYNLLLPAIWSFLNLPRRQETAFSSVNVWQTTLKHAFGLSSKSALKRSAFDFVARIVLLETDAQYRGDFRLGHNMNKENVVVLETWITHLPKVLWELGSTNESTTEVILLFLLRTIQRRSTVPVITEKVISALHSRFVPYFSAMHAVRGQVPGPFTKLPEGCKSRHLALDLAALLSGHIGGQSAALIDAVELAVTGMAEENYWRQLKTQLMS
ncbi:hypothetical protein D9758_000204 [Tetrapyrgos nigripes]|uniref:Pre-rRNA-processing protein n=1 Tax=Tetrapyrgos nigripes TaxID=182062 RepID=A0A8H5H1J9_9AGAR|nr:hypothetical protein D9758_000204 [Tetrapyrgos nigripes]